MSDKDTSSPVEARRVVSPEAIFMDRVDNSGRDELSEEICKPTSYQEALIDQVKVLAKVRIS